MEVLDEAKELTCLWLLLWAVTPVNGKLDSRSCDEGWFGPKCEMQCHCARHLSCNMDGSCELNDWCMEGYFGPGCQYVNLFFEEGWAGNPTFLTDNNHSTCNPDSQDESVTVALRSKFIFTWMRLHIKNKDLDLDHLKLESDGHEEGCPLMKWTLVDTTVDIVCLSNVSVSSITFKNPLASSLCSAYFSGGRNVAVKQNVRMSSATEEGLAEFSVDGYKDNLTLENNSFCSQTRDNRDPATWTLIFRIPYIIYRIQVYTTADYPHTLAGLKIGTFDSNSTIIEEFKAADTETGTTLSARMTSATPVLSVKLTAGTVYRVTDGNLTLCEVETYGVAVCEKNKYGFACDKTCKCGEQELCFALTGGCMHGCRDGWYGSKCDKQCPKSCFLHSCFSGTGKCHSCHAGFIGDVCNETCPTGRFGSNCERLCPSRCANTECNHITGQCEKCPTGRGGPECEYCPAGTFGNECSRKCSQKCDSSVPCDRVSGTCQKCVFNYTGSTCSECIVGKYGQGCDKDCSRNCNKGICNSSTGVCASCALGFHGPKCGVAAKVEDSSASMAWLVIPAFGIFPVIYGIVTFTKNRKRRSATVPGTLDRRSRSSSE